MQLRSIAINAKSMELTLAWFAGEENAEYTTFRSSEAAVPEFYRCLMSLGRKVWTDYLQLSEKEINFLTKAEDALGQVVKNAFRKNVAVTKVGWQHKLDKKNNIAYIVNISLVYKQEPDKYVKITVPKISIPVFREEAAEKLLIVEKEKQLHIDYVADKELEDLLETLEDLCLAYISGERAQGTIPGMEEEVEK